VSDFLTNLALRSSASADVIRPRLPSLFEPRRPAVGLPTTPSFAVEEQTQDTSDGIGQQRDAQTASVRDPSSVGAQQAQHRREPRPVVPSPPADAPVPARAALPPVRESQPDLAPRQTRPGVQASESGTNSPQIPVRASHIATEIVASLRQQRDEPGRGYALAEAPIQAETSVGERSHGAVAADSHTTAATTQKSFSDSPARFEAPTAVRMESPRFQVDRTSQLVSSIIQARVASHSEDRRRQIPLTRTEQPEPVIHVTIGRVDVRATPQQQPVSRGHSASPVMSLDEYLRQRRAGA
jgi:hypothetical protein